jgi:tripartite ATP-independent transporter DctP family solute receptor
MAQTQLRLAHHHPVDGQIDLTAKKFADLVKERTNGEINIRIFPAAQLAQELEAIDLLHQGAFDLTIVSVPPLDKYYKPAAMTVLPFLFRDWNHIQKAYRGEFGDLLAQGLRDNSNIDVLGWLGLGFKDMLFRGEPVTSLPGMAGLKMRSPEQFVYIRMFELLGAKPTPVTWGEVYTAMQMGVADGLETPPALVLDMKFNEVVQSVVRTHHMFSSMALAINQQKLATFSEEQQRILREAGEEAVAWAEETITIPAEAAAYEKLQAVGMTVADVSDIDAWRKAVQPLWTEIEERAPGSSKYIEIVNAVQ